MQSNWHEEIKENYNKTNRRRGIRCTLRELREKMKHEKRWNIKEGHDKTQEKEGNVFCLISLMHNINFSLSYMFLYMFR